jgi:hypothetical protein
MNSSGLAGLFSVMCHYDELERKLDCGSLRKCYQTVVAVQGSALLALWTRLASGRLVQHIERLQYKINI